MGTEPHVSDSLVFLDAANQCLHRRGQTIPLTPKAFAVLRHLTERPGQLVTKEELLNAAWPGTYVSDAALKVCISRLRQALGDLSHPPRYIETVHWRGYRLLVPIPPTPPRTPRSEPEKSKEPKENHVSNDKIQKANNEKQSPIPSLVGRNAELQYLHELLVKAQDSERQTVFVTGAPGVGKTALVEAFLLGTKGLGLETREENQDSKGQKPKEQVENQPPSSKTQVPEVLAFNAQHSDPSASDVRRPIPDLWIAQGQCIEHYGAGESYLPVLEALNRLGRTSEGERLVAILRRHAPMWLAQLPSLLNPAERKRLQRDVRGSSRQRMLREMAEALEVLTEEITLILVLEDLHWSDYATLDLVSFLAHRSEPARLLILGVYRPEELAPAGHPLKNIRHNLQTRHQCQELAIPPLSPEAINEYLQRRFPGHAFPPVLAALLSKRTGGNPLFLVTITEHLVTRGLITSQESGWKLNGALEDVQTEMPDSIQQIIAAQIDRLTTEEQNILEVASVAGMDFSAATVAAGLDAEVIAIETFCEELARRGQFLRVQGVDEWPDGIVAARYEFMHSLYQQAWYERVTAARRVQLHRRIGERGERAYGDQVRKIAAELAVHFERGRNVQRAVLYRYYAADNAMYRFGYQEAISHLTTGLELLSTQPAAPERDQQEIALQSTLGAARLATQGYAEPAVEQAYARAYALCQQVATPPDLAPALHGLWAYHLARAEFSSAQTFATRLLQVAQQEQSRALLLEAERVLGQTLYFLGTLPEARRYLESSFKRYNSHEHAAHIFLYGQDPGVVSLAQNARTLSLMGSPDQAIQQAEAAVALAKEVAHPYSLALAQYQAAVVYHTQRDLQRMQAILEATVALSPEYGIPYWLSSMQVLKGWLLANQGERQAGIELMRQGLTVSQEIGTALNRPYSLALLAEMYGSIGETAKGLVLLQEAEQLVTKTGGHFNQAEIYRLAGELTLQQCTEQDKNWQVTNTHRALPPAPIAAEAEGYFLKALGIAQRQEAKLLELRAGVSLSRLWQRQGKGEQAQQFLTTLYDWFTEGFDAVDLQEAKRLLEELR